MKTNQDVPGVKGKSNQAQRFDLLLAPPENNGRDDRTQVQMQPEFQSLNERLEVRVQERTVALQSEIAERRRIENQVRQQLNQINRRLRNSQTRYRRLFETAPDGLLHLDAQTGAITEVNPFMAAMLGCSRGECLGKQPWELGLFQDRGAGQAALEILREKGYVRLADLPLKAKDGHCIDVEFVGHLYSGERQGLIQCHIRDISERKRTAAALQQSQERLALILDATSDALWDWDLRTGQAYFSSGWSAMLGYEPGELPENIETWRNLLHPEDRGQALACLQAHFTRQQEIFVKEFRLRTKTGSWCWVLSRGKVVERDEKGEPVRMIGTHTNITERKEMEESLRRSEEHFRTLIEYASDLITVLDTDGQFVYQSPSLEHVLGYKPGELIGQPVRQFIHPEDLQKTLAGFNQAGDGASPVLPPMAVEHRFRHKDGSWRILESICQGYRDEAGCLKRVLNSRDISEKKHLEKLFLRAQRMESIGRLASGVAHDLNNILTPIVMSTSLLRLKLSHGDIEATLKILENSAHRGADLIKQLLTFGCGIEGARIPVRFKHLIRDHVKFIQETFPKNITINSHTPPDLWLIQADETQLQQVLLNLSVNARDAMPQGGLLTLTASNIQIDEHFPSLNPDTRSGPYVWLEVSDTGTGIPPEILDKIFDPFFTTKQPGKGTGLGLSTVLGIVKSHGGFVNMRSALGQGTTFDIYLPATSGSPAPDTTTIHPTGPKGQGQLILVVDDERSICTLAKGILENHGYTVITADNGAEAMDQYIKNRHNIKVILTDIMMPLMDGLALVQALRKMGSRVRCIASSGLNSGFNEIKKAEFRALGVTLFLSKPYAADKLLNVLHQLLSTDPGATP